MYGAAILFLGHPYIESATALSNKVKLVLYLDQICGVSILFFRKVIFCKSSLSADNAIQPHVLGQVLEW